jgi:hypothetical protein
MQAARSSSFMVNCLTQRCTEIVTVGSLTVENVVLFSVAASNEVTAKTRVNCSQIYSNMSLSIIIMMIITIIIIM